jgi:hypothetical protein
MTPLPALIAFLLALADVCPHCGKYAPARPGLDVRSAYPVGRYCPCCWGKR